MNKTLMSMLRIIWTKDTFTYKDLELSMKLDKSTISRNIRFFKEAGVIEPIVKLSSAPLGGRRSTLYKFNSKLFNIVGISVEQDGLDYLVTDLKNEEIESGKISTKISRENLFDLIRQILKEQENILCIGISVPGIIKESTLVYSEALGIKNLDFKDIVKDFEVPFFLVKDTHAGLCNFQNLSKNVVYLLLSVPFYVNEPVGLGIGLYLDGKLITGANYYAGEYKINIALSEEKITFNEIKDKRGIVHINEFINQITKVICPIISVLDPELIVIGGNITYLREEIKFLEGTIKNGVYLSHERNLNIIFADPESNKISLGTVKFVTQKCIQDEILLDYFLRKTIEKNFASLTKNYQMVNKGY